MKIKVEKISYGVNRPQEWIDEHPQFAEMQKRLKWEVEQRGVPDPLVVEDAVDDGYYVCVKGNQMLMCLKDNKLLEEVDCVYWDDATIAQKAYKREWDPDIIFPHLIPDAYAYVPDEPDGYA